MSEFKHYFESLDEIERRQLAKSGKTSVAYLSQIANGHRSAGANMIENYVVAGRVDVATKMRPLIFGKALKKEAA